MERGGRSVDIMVTDNSLIDFSIMPSLECNLHCSFCMYDASKYNTSELDYEKAKEFIGQWDWDCINSVGFYGGEPSINLPLYQKFMNLVPESVSKFIITNGTWSTDIKKTNSFVDFLCFNTLFLIVSGTPEHTPYQNRAVLQAMKDYLPEAVRLKGGDVIHKMGRGIDYPGAVSECSGFCNEDSRVTRLAIMPTGNVVYQNCHGNYPFVQSLDDPFEGIHKRIRDAVTKCRGSWK